ncbi:MAG: 4-alpha-glucanotransferase [Sulfitobacter sp.]
MNIDHDLAALAELCGILPRFFDLHGGERITSPETQRAMLAAEGIDVSNDKAIQDSLAHLRHELDDRWFPWEIIVESGIEAPQNFGLGAEWHLCADGSEKIVASGEPRDYITVPPLASGIYSLTATASGRTEIVTVLAAPRRLPGVADLTGHTKLWGLNLALYGLRSERNTGLGDFEDLAGICEAAGSKGAGFLGINPLHNMGFCEVTAISPYSPSHRGFLNTSYIALDQIPGLKPASKVAGFAKVRKAKSIQYADHKAAHNKALGSLFAKFMKSASASAKAEFEAFKAEYGEELGEFARFETLSEIHGSDWREWPEQTAEPRAERIEFHMWMQWVATVQLQHAQERAKASGMALGLYLDLAVGSRRDGAEAWCEQTVVAKGVSIGAPPDHLSPEGQNWNLTAFSPRKLKAARYRPLRRIIGQMIRHAGIIRIDHVLGLNRSFWLPDDGSPGGYIRQPFESLLAVIKIEAERHNCAVVGEDLGLVPDGFRDTMREHGFYGYSVLQYEKDNDGKFRDPSDIPTQILSCFATHDTPTVKGYEIGRDVDWWEKLDWIDGPAAETLRQDRAREVAAFNGGGDFRTNIHARLAYSDANLVAVQLDDIEATPEAQNLPGTIDQHPNWRRKYDVALNILPQHACLTETAAMMRDAGRSTLEKGQTHEN